LFTPNQNQGIKNGERQEIHIQGYRDPGYISLMVAGIHQSCLVAKIRLFYNSSRNLLPQLWRCKAAVLSKAESAAVSLPIAACMEERSLPKPMFM